MLLMPPFDIDKPAAFGVSNFENIFTITAVNGDARAQCDVADNRITWRRGAASGIAC